MKERIFYIDALKAFAILLVVIGHESFFSPVDDKVYGIVTIFHMPLFMAVSGFVTNPEKIHLPKRAKMFIPFLIFGLSWTLLIGLTVSDFFTEEFKRGYWYLYVLFVFCLLLAACRRLPWRLEVGMILVQCFLMSLHLAFHGTAVGETLSTNHMFQLWPFFCLGILFRRGLLAWLQKRELPTILLSLLIVEIFRRGGNFLGIADAPLAYLHDLMSVFIVTILFLLFAKMETYHIKNKLCRWLAAAHWRSMSCSIISCILRGCSCRRSGR